MKASGSADAVLAAAPVAVVQRLHEVGREPACSESAPLTRGPLEFEAVYAQTFEMVWRSLRMLGVQSALLDDAIQDVFGAVARQLPGFEGKSSLRTWVFGIVQNVANNHRRTRQRKHDCLEALPDVVVSDEPTPHAHAEGREAADVVLAFCASLDESRRTLFVLGVLERVPASDIAAALRISVNSVYARIHVLRQELRQLLQRREEEM